MDIESATDELKTHPRSISKILPESFPTSFLLTVDRVDEVSLSIVELLQRSPTFRLLSLVYIVCLHIAIIVLFLRKYTLCKKHM